MTDPKDTETTTATPDAGALPVEGIQGVEDGAAPAGELSEDEMEAASGGGLTSGHLFTPQF